MSKEEAKKIIVNFINDYKSKIYTSFPSPFNLSMAIYTVVHNEIEMPKPYREIDFFSEEQEKRWYKRHYHICANIYQNRTHYK